MQAKEDSHTTMCAVRQRCNEDRVSNLFGVKMVFKQLKKVKNMLVEVKEKT